MNRLPNQPNPLPCTRQISIEQIDPSFDKAVVLVPS